MCRLERLEEEDKAYLLHADEAGIAEARHETH
jgi:hypothetical protein